MAYGVEGVTLRGKKLLPDRIDIDVKASVPLAKDVATTTVMTLTIKDIGVEVDSANFWYEHYTFPKVTDQGNINLVIAGMDVLMEIANAPDDSRHFFKLNRASCKIDSVRYDISEAKHSTAYKMLKPVLQPALRTQIEHAVEDKFTAFVNMLDHQLIKRRAQVKQMREESAAVNSKAQQEVSSKIAREAGGKHSYDDPTTTTQHHAAVPGHSETKVKEYHGDGTKTKEHKHADLPGHHTDETKVKEHKHGDLPGHHAEKETKVKEHKLGSPRETKVETKEHHHGEPGYETKVKEQHHEPGHPHHKVETTTTTKEKSDKLSTSPTVPRVH